MKMYHNGTDYVIAESEDDARRAVLSHHGYTDQYLAEHPGSESDIDGDGWYAMAMDYRFTLHDETFPEPCRSTRTVAEWIACSPAGFFASSEY